MLTETQNWIEPFSAELLGVRLEPLSLAHEDAMLAAVRDGELWKQWYTVVPSPEQMSAEIKRRLSQPDMTAFSIWDAQQSGKALGMTTIMHIVPEHRRAEIGFTWLRKSAQGSGVNKACKYLLLQRLFEIHDAIAVEFRTHFFNRTSQRAIESLGAKRDGVLRNHSISRDGSYRDECVYSIIQSEWPAVKMNLRAKLNLLEEN